METISFLLAFSFLRRYCGGLHAVAPAYCFLSTVCLYGLALWATLFVNTLFLIIGAAMAAILIYRCAPIEHENNILNLRQKQIFRRYSRCIVVTLSGTAISTAMYMDSHAMSMVLCTIILNGANIITQKNLVYPKLRMKKTLLCAFAVCVSCVGISSLQSACRNWSYQPKITVSLRKYMDE
ncbi:hypothetical protein D3Z48_20250 [Clostridiaceae bacterium]|nr:hypothetical protein [Clostridiaceae bacterium]